MSPVETQFWSPLPSSHHPQNEIDAAPLASGAEVSGSFYFPSPSAHFRHAAIFLRSSRLVSDPGSLQVIPLICVSQTLTSLRGSSCGRQNNAPQKMSTSQSLGPCGYAALCGKRDFPNTIKYFEMGILSWII